MVNPLFNLQCEFVFVFTGAHHGILLRLRLATRPAGLFRRLSFFLAGSITLKINVIYFFNTIDQHLLQLVPSHITWVHHRDADKVGCAVSSGPKELLKFTACSQHAKMWVVGKGSPGWIRGFVSLQAMRSADSQMSSTVFDRRF